MFGRVAGRSGATAHRGLSGQMKCTTFRRWFSSREALSMTHANETDTERVQLAELMAKGEFADFICGRLEETLLYRAEPERHGESGYYTSKRCLQFVQDPDDYDGHYRSLTFLFSLSHEKVAFANWVVEHKLGDFRHVDASVFATDIVPVA